MTQLNPIMNEAATPTTESGEVWVIVETQLLDAVSPSFRGVVAMTINDGEDVPSGPYLSGRDDPVLNEIWDNAADAVYDSM